MRARLMRIFACILIAAIAPSMAQAQSADELAALNQQVEQLYGQGKYAEAGALAEQVLAASERVLGMLPAVSSLKALRATGHPSAATKPMIGFGNPLLDGPDSRYAAIAKLAREKQSCPKTAWQRAAALFGLHDGVVPIETRGGLANVSQIRQQAGSDGSPG